MPQRIQRCLIVGSICSLGTMCISAAAEPASVPAPAAGADIPLKITIDPNNTGGTISPLLFGHNIEHTRHAVWRGLSAQMVANRKFAGQAGAEGVAGRWSGIGIEGVEFTLDPKEPFAGPQSQRGSITKAGINGGIGQSEIHLKEGVKYELRLCVKAEHRLQVFARIRDRYDQTSYTQQAVQLPAGEWLRAAFTFTAPRTDESARLEITAETDGTFWVGAASLMPADNFHGMRRDVVELLKEMSVPLLRWPGGNFTRDYRWKEGLLPVDQRPPIRASAPSTLPFTESYDFHEIGTDDFLALCAYLGAEPSLTINMADVPPEESADWVQYCNGSAESQWGKVRAERGHPEPYGVKYWSIGNEIYADWMGPAHSDAATYARRIEQYARAMKQADPSIVLIASGAAGAPVAEAGWDRTVIAGAGEHFDHIAEHHYAKTKGDAQDELARLAKIPTTELYTKWGAARQTINAASPGGKSIGIAFDEWNIWHPWFAAPFKNEWHIGSRDGIYVASLLNMLCRESDSLGVSMAAYFQPVNEGAIAVTPFSARLTPIGQVFALYRAHHGNRLIKLQQLPGDSDVDVCASISGDGARVAVTLVNRNPVLERVVELALPSERPVHTVTAKFLVAAGLDADAGLRDRTEAMVVPADHRLTLTLPAYSAVLLETRSKHE